MNDVTFTNNTSVGSAGALLVVGPAMDIFNSTFSANLAVFGGAVYAVMNDIEIADTTFDSNEAGGIGGALWVGGSYLDEGVDVLVHNGIFSNNIASDSGAAILCDSGVAPCNLDVTADNTSLGQFVNNIAGEVGAAIMTTPVILDEGCIECPPSDPFFPIPGILNITNILFDGNTTLNLLIDDEEPGYGAAVFTANALNILGSTFTNNTGSSIIHSYDDLNITNSNFTENQGPNIFSEPLMDGPIEIDINSSLFENNNSISPAGGGGLFLSIGFGGTPSQYTVNIDSSEFIGNDGPAVNLLDIGAVFFGTTNQVNLTNTSILSNLPIPFTFTGPSSIAVWGPIFSLTNSTVANNFGGGVNLYSFGTTEHTITNSTITNNTNDTSISLIANQGGGVRNLGGILNIINSTIANNQAVSYPDGDPEIENESELGLGGGIYTAGGGDVFLTNTIISDNQASENGQDCYVGALGLGGSITSNGINLFSNTTGCTANFHEDDILDVSALLEALADNGGLTFTRLLSALSPALDAGDDALAPATDQRGIARPQGVASDIGAVEMEEGGGDPAPVIAEVTPVPTPTVDTTPNYTFSSTEAGTITYGGSCSSVTTAAILGNNTVTFNTLAPGTYTNCTIQVTDLAAQPSNLLNVSAFTIENPPTPPSGGGGGGGAGGGFGQPASSGPSTPDQPAQPEPTLPENPPTPEVPNQPEQPSVPEVPAQPDTPSQPQQNTPTPPTQPDQSTPDEPEIIFVTEETPTDSPAETTGAGIYGREINKTQKQLSASCNYSEFAGQYGITINQNSDADGDGLSDQLECLAQTNPTEADTDGDGLSDAYEELTLGSNPRQSDGQPGDDFLIITTPEDNMLTGDESPMVKGINTLKGDVDIYIFDRADFDDIAKQIQDELNADENLNAQQRAELYQQRFTDYVQSILAKFINDSLDPENPAEAKFLNRIQLLGEAPTGNNSVFLLDSEKTLVDNLYLAMAHNADDLYSRETEFRVDSTLKVLNPNVNTLGSKPIPAEALLGELKIEIDPGNFRPVLAGNIKEPSKVVANWQSDIVSSALIADSLDEDFRLSAPTDLEAGEHTVYVTAYRRSDGAQSETLKIPFTISADGTISFSQNNNNLWIYLGAGIILLGGLTVILLRKRHTKKPPYSVNTPTTKLNPIEKSPTPGDFSLPRLFLFILYCLLQIFISAFNIFHHCQCLFTFRPMLENLF